MTAWLPMDADRSVASAASGEWWLAAVVPGDDAPVAAVRVRTSIGFDRPRYWYRLGCTVHAAAELDLFHRQTTLLLVNDHTGAAELADLAFDPRRLDAAGVRAVHASLLAAGLRLIQDEVHAGRCNAETVIAELPGARTQDGHSPFWKGLGRHFYPDDVMAAAARFGVAWRSHAATLMPRQILYASMLNSEAQAAIDRVGPPYEPVMAALRAAGFRSSRCVRIDDGGPVLEMLLSRG
jgi:arginine N-succinyltransferase